MRPFDLRDLGTLIERNGRNSGPPTRRLASKGVGPRQLFGSELVLLVCGFREPQLFRKAIACRTHDHGCCDNMR